MTLDEIRAEIESRLDTINPFPARLDQPKLVNRGWLTREQLPEEMRKVHCFRLIAEEEPEDPSVPRWRIVPQCTHDGADPIENYYRMTQELKFLSKVQMAEAVRVYLGGQPFPERVARRDLFGPRQSGRWFSSWGHPRALLTQGGEASCEDPSD